MLAASRHHDTDHQKLLLSSPDERQDYELAINNSLDMTLAVADYFLSISRLYNSCLEVNT
jgi:hypothetical protein